MEADPFDLLGVSELSSDETIDAAWRRRIKLCHPDYATSDADRGRRLAESIAVNRAHDVLTDPVRKADAIKARHRRNGTQAPGAAGTTAGPGSEGAGRTGRGASPGTGRVRDIWAGTRWARAGRYRAGGHPEDRDGWSYAAYEPEAGAGQGVATETPPAAATSPLDRTLGILETTCSILVWMVLLVLRPAWWLIHFLLFRRWPIGRDDL